MNRRIKFHVDFFGEDKLQKEKPKDKHGEKKSQ